MLTISLIAQKGGVGKTSIARCLAVAFERSGTTSAILDMDPQGSATAWGNRREAAHPEVIATVVSCLDNTLGVAQGAVEVVIIDTPPKNAEVAIAAVRVSDLVIIPCRPQIDDIETLPATRQVLDIVGGMTGHCSTERRASQPCPIQRSCRGHFRSPYRGISRLPLLPGVPRSFR